ncbi:MAG: phosphatase PAP2 family protein, partial [Propionibacteriales bacterium]|nr:phosphatase PAP2 family protein [Propionibacteriales bacterium]
MTGPRADRRAALVAAGLAAPVVLLTVLVSLRFSPLTSFDADVVRSWQGSVVDTSWHRVFLVIAAISQPIDILAVSAVAAVVLAIRGRTRLAVWIVVIGVSQRSAYGVMKLLVHRQRPDVPDQIAGFSFPSGHATAIAAGMGILIVVTLRGVRPKRLRRSLVALWLSLVVLVGADRVALGAHNPSDVVAGWFLGAFVVFAASA